MQASLNKFCRVTFQSFVADVASGQLGNCFSNNFCAESIPLFQTRRSKNLCHQRPYSVARLSSLERVRTSAGTSASSALGVNLRTNSEARFTAHLSSRDVNGSIFTLDVFGRARPLIEFAGITVLPAKQSAKLCCLGKFTFDVGKNFLIKHEHERVARARRGDVEKAFEFLLSCALDGVFQILRFVFFAEGNQELAVRGRFHEIWIALTRWS